MEEGAKQPFVITGSYAQWKSVIKKELDPVKAMMQGKLKLKGNLPMIVRNVKAAQSLVENASKVDTHFLDE
jgi:putative sterol carrier protein